MLRKEDPSSRPSSIQASLGYGRPHFKQNKSPENKSDQPLHSTSNLHKIWKTEGNVNMPNDTWRYDQQSQELIFFKKRSGELVKHLPPSLTDPWTQGKRKERFTPQTHPVASTPVHCQPYQRRDSDRKTEIERQREKKQRDTKIERQRDRDKMT